MTGSPVLSSPRGAGPRAGGEIQRSIPCSSIRRGQLRRAASSRPARSCSSSSSRDRLAALDQLGGLRGVEVAEAGEPVRVDLRRLGGDDPAVPLHDLVEVGQGGHRRDLVAGVGQPVADRRGSGPGPPPEARSRYGPSGHAQHAAVRAGLDRDASPGRAGRRGHGAAPARRR